MIDCASTYTAVVLRPGRRRTEFSGPASLEGVGPAGGRGGWAVAGGRVVRRLHTTERPLISAKSNHRPIRGLVSVGDNVDVATFRYPMATELRVYVIQSTYGLDDRWFINDVPGSR